MILSKIMELLILQQFYCVYIDSFRYGVSTTDVIFKIVKMLHTLTLEMVNGSNFDFDWRCQILL